MEVYADGEHVADITGEAFKLWDVYSLRSTNGELMFSEEENLSLITADASKFDADGNECGKYHQNINPLFLDVTFTSPDGAECGHLHQDLLSLVLELDIRDADGNVCFHARKAFLSFGARITIERVGDGAFPSRTPSSGPSSQTSCRSCMRPSPTRTTGSRATRAELAPAVSWPGFPGVSETGLAACRAARANISTSSRHQEEPDHSCISSLDRRDYR